MKRIFALIALISVTGLAAAADMDNSPQAVGTGESVASPTSTSGVTPTHTCSLLSPEEPNVVINLSRQVLASVECNTTSNGIGAATIHPGGRTTACNSQRCAYAVTTNGGPVVAMGGGTAAPSSGGDLAACTTAVAAFTGGDTATLAATTCGQ